MRAAWLLGVSLLAVSAPANAQEIELSGPLHACVASLNRYCQPATLEWAPWVSGAIGFGDRTLLGAGVGLELTAGVLEWSAFPLAAGATKTTRYRAELRVGPWGYAETRGGDGAIAEAGVTAHFGTNDDDLMRLVEIVPAGMFDLRLGGGYGAFPAGRAAHAAVALGWGLRVAPDRTWFGGACDEMPKPKTLIDATLVRLVATGRHAPEIDAWELALALEISPTAGFLLDRVKEKLEHHSRAPSRPPSLARGR
ncbi:MAG: hypothetical protein KIT84_00050 [Labilithrix sp.]|nr:hypothetical protein [Labilithrix sp.]MCW5809373.1 hypothetical protein [Labilithrix sp.]